MVIPKEDGTDAADCMSQALEDANLKAGQIDYINAHGTSTQQNDRVETRAIKQLFGEHAYKIPISSTKSMIGHSIGASGAIETVVSCLTIKDQIIPPTINYKEKDPDCDLDYVPGQARKAKIQKVLSNSFGFGSNNVCLAFGKYDG
jgi:3-oxoacyl-[acyl-carrier-protein] synthase II